MSSAIRVPSGQKGAQLPDGPRLAPVTDPDEAQKELLQKTLLSPGAAPLNLFTTLAHNTLLMKRVNALGGVFMAHGSLPARERELVILRVAGRVGSEYEAAQHRSIAAKVGVTLGEIDRIADEDLDDWSDAERVLLQAADELCATDDLTDATWAGLEQRLSSAQILELVVMIGFYRMLGGLLRGLRVEVDAG